LFSDCSSTPNVDLLSQITSPDDDSKHPSPSSTMTLYARRGARQEHVGTTNRRLQTTYAAHQHATPYHHDRRPLVALSVTRRPHDYTYTATSLSNQTTSLLTDCLLMQSEVITYIGLMLLLLMIAQLARMMAAVFNYSRHYVIGCPYISYIWKHKNSCFCERSKPLHF